jgi:hemoglobin-like flavoprotein
MEQTMVRQKTIELVKSTAPILKKHGQQITTRMYKIMFQKHPDIQKKFDMSAQADGSQAIKLATAVYNYADKIDNLPALKSMIEKIAYRHVQSHVLPEEYSVVGESLLQAMKEVLGKAATEEVMAAWTEAYQVLSEVFIQREEHLYRKLETIQ